MVCEAVTRPFMPVSKARVASTSKPREASSYGSEEFHHDVEMHQQGKFPDDLDRLVLSEDGIYNVITGHYQTAIRMIELATQKLKDY